MVDQRESQAGTWSEPCTTLDPATPSGLPLIFGSDLRCRPTAADRCDAATRASGHRFVVMPQVLWQTMMREFPEAHVVTGMLPSEDAAAGLGRVRDFLLGRLASALPVSGMYAIAEIVAGRNPRPMCLGFSQRCGRTRCGRGRNGLLFPLGEPQELSIR